MEMDEKDVNFEFIDVDDPKKEPMENLDMDNVILDDAQKKLLFKLINNVKDNRNAASTDKLWAEFLK